MLFTFSCNDDGIDAPGIYALVAGDEEDRAR